MSRSRSNRCKKKLRNRREEFYLNFISQLRGVYSDQLCIAGNYVYNIYKDSVETGYYLSSDKINDLMVLTLNENNNRITPVLACQNRCLRILDVILHFEIPLVI